MTTLFKKLNLAHHTEILVLDSPEPFERELAKLSGVKVHRRASGAKTPRFCIAFATTLGEVERAAAVFEKNTEGDAVVWIAYPKGTSKNYTCEFNRDSGWDALGGAGFEAVRQISIDHDWSAVRFRRVEFIKSMTRDAMRALSKSGKSRTRK